MDDERSVDVDEPRDPAPGDASMRPALAVGVGRLPPTRQAWSHYVTHANRCDACLDIDQRCDVGEARYRAWRQVADRALDELAGGRDRP